MAKKTPGSLSEASHYFFQRIWTWASRRSLAVRIGALVLTLVGLLLLARFNIFGDPYYRYAKILLPHNIPYVDPELAVIPLTTNFFIEDERGYRSLALGTTCYEGDRIRVEFEVGTPAWVTVFDLDTKGPHPLFQNKLDPSPVEPDKLYTITFSLDDTVGKEILYVIASSTRFSFKEDIEPYLTVKARHLDSIKGPARPEHSLAIPETFVQGFGYCRHLLRD